jgi:TolB-like protein/Flp pilus assembly protein TadD
VSTEQPGLRFEIGHVLFIDIVAYSKLLITEQSELLRKLTAIVLQTEQFRIADTEGKLVRLPTGDGMALVFRTSPEAPVQCALELSKRLKSHPELRVRMGIHSGPVNEVTDMNDRINITGAGINIAQRVMDCGDAGHILLSKHVADDLEQYPQWREHLHELGQVETKHGAKIDVVSFYNDEAGNAEAPEKFQQATRERKAMADRAVSARRWKGFVGAALFLAIAASVVLWVTFHRVFSKASIPVSEKSIAVLPLENLSEEKENAFFAEGIQDDILTSLAKISDLKVISRTSVMQYRGVGAARNFREIAKALGVENILEGSVRRSGNRVVVNVQLIDTRHDRHIWAERYDRTIADSMSIQGELAGEIASALRAKLAPEEKVRLETKPTKNADAYVLYLKGLERGRRVNGSTEDQIAAEQLYTQAITLDPAFALAHARASLINSHISEDPARRIKARRQAEEAVHLDPGLGDAHLALGLCLYWGEKDYGAALKEFALAAEASPNDAEPLHYMAGIYRRQGRWRESIAKYERAQELDPRNRTIIFFAAVDYLLVRDWPAGTASCNRALEISPDSVKPKVTLAYLEVFRNGTPASGREILRKIPGGVDSQGSVVESKWDLAMLQRDFDGAEKILNDFPSPNFPTAEGFPKGFVQGRVALARGDVNSAQLFFAAAAPGIESWARSEPDKSEAQALLALFYAYMGRKEDATREARHVVEMEPESQNAYYGASRAADLALVYALTGEADQAITLIERLLTIPGPVQWPSSPSSITLADLRLRWEWDSLRTNPRFQKILEGPEPKTVY